MLLASAGGHREAAGSLMNMAWRSTELAAVMVGAGAIPPLVQLLTNLNSTDMTTLENAAGALLNILSHKDSAAAAAAAAEAGIIKAVSERLLPQGQNKWSRLGAKLLGCMVAAVRTADEEGRGHRVVVGQLVSSGAVAPLCSLAVAPPAAGPARETQALALQTLGLFGACDHASLSASILDYPSLVTVLVGNLDPSRPSELR
jgi:hypothetical protein